MNLDRLLRPRSIAVFGGGAAAELIRQCDAMGFDGEIWPVHPKLDEVEGRAVYREVGSLPSAPDAAYLAVNRELTVRIVGELSARGAGGAICYATGFGEAGEQGAALERELLDGCGDMPLIGPNCYGLLNYVDGAMLWPDQQGGRRVERGVALVTMSSNVAFNLTMQRRGLPIAYVVSLGNKLRFDLHDAIRAFARRDEVTAIGLYTEGISDPAAFGAAAEVAREAGTPLVAIKTGRSEDAQRVVMSHTASLAGSDELISALFERHGVARVHSLEALIEALKLLHVVGPLPGGRVGVASTSGGDLSLFADALDGSELTIPPLSSATEKVLGEVVHERLVAANPLDYQMFDWNDAARLEVMFERFLSDDFDIAVSLLDPPRDDRCDPVTWEGAERGFVRAVTKVGARGAIVSTLTDTLSESDAERIADEGVVVLGGVDSSVAALAAAAQVGAALKAGPSAPVLALSPGDAGDVEAIDEAAAKAILAERGIPIPAGQVVTSPEEAAAVAGGATESFAVKALGVAHKTEVGAVRLGVRGAAALADAVQDMGGVSDRFLVEEMIEDPVVELIVGVARDPQFGPYLVIGGGGTLVELVRDTCSLLLPTNDHLISEALHGLRCAPLFDGYRGGPAADIEAAVQAIGAIADWVMAEPGSIDELDVNPLLVRPRGKGAVAADAMLVLRTRAETNQENQR